MAQCKKLYFLVEVTFSEGISSSILRVMRVFWMNFEIIQVYGYLSVLVDMPKT